MLNQKIMKTKSTPGPWKVDTDFKLQEEDYHKISIGSTKEISGCISMADARLIAASPDMIEALQLVLKTGNGPLETFVKIKAAISKATNG